MAEKKFKLKLLVDKGAKKVLFAEAEKEIADFLFYLLSLPVATVVRVLEKDSKVGCLANLYESIKGLSETHMQPNRNKNSLLNPKSPISSTEIPLLLPGHKFESRKVYVCPCCNSNVADNPKIVCVSCGKQMTREVPYLTVPVGEGGFVKGPVTYMIMDNLVLKPMSTISSITITKNVSSLEEKVVDFGVEEGKKLLKAALECENVLTSVFPQSTRPQQRSS